MDGLAAKKFYLAGGLRRAGVYDKINKVARL